jgi:hypothetical protein
MKVVYFDYWTRGLANFKAFDDGLKAEGAETLLLHIGSFRFEHEKEETIGGILCRDISYYGTKYVYEMLEKEKPDIVVSLNTTYLFDRAMVLACRKLGIQSVFIMHGIRSFGKEGNEEYLSEIKKAYNPLLKKLSKGGKYIGTVIPNYIHSLYKYSPKKVFNGHFLKVIYSYFNDPGKTFRYPEYSDEVLHDKCLIYCRNEVEYYSTLGYKDDQIIIVGSPKFDLLLEEIKNNKLTFEFLPEEAKTFLDNGKEKYALILDDPYPEQNNYGGINNEDRQDYYIKMADKFKKMGYKTIIKLHPSSIRENINIIREDVLITREFLDTFINNAAFCIAQFSTTINNCVLMNKPIVKAHWGKYKNVIKFYSEIGISNLWENFEDEINIEFNEEVRDAFIDKFITVREPIANQNIVSNILK